MKPPLDHLIQRPHPYTTAEQSRQPGYLARRFAEIKAEQEKRREIAEAIAKASRLWFNQEPLGAEFSSVLYENLWDLYEG